MFVSWRALVPEEDEDLRSGATTTSNVPTFPWPIGLPPPSGKWPPAASPGFLRPFLKRSTKRKRRPKERKPIIVGLNLIV